VGAGEAGDRVYLVLERLPDASSARQLALGVLAHRLGLRSADISELCKSLPAVIPAPLSPFQDAERIITELAVHGVRARLAPRKLASAHCTLHPKLDATRTCSRCRRRGCPVCVVTVDHVPHCFRCRRFAMLGRGFFLLRVSLLLTVLVLVGLWGYGDVKSRGARTEWQRTLSVALVVVAAEAVDPEAVARLGERLAALEQQLAEQFSLYRSGPAPFRFVLYGPAQAGSPPKPPNDGNLAELAWHNVRQWSYLSEIDASLGLNKSAYDSRIYVVARPPKDSLTHLVEGYGEQGGRVGIVEVELSESMVDPVLAVVAHELFHTLGAEDKYDTDGRTLIPLGLADPHREPLLPQTAVEIMARGRPIDATHERSLDHLGELAVGPMTAKEIGWAQER